MTERKRPMTTARRLAWFAGGQVARVLRVAVAWMLVIACLGLVVTRVSIARASDAGLNFSEELLQIGEHHVSGDLGDDVYAITLNGQMFYSSNASSTRSLDEVLGYFQEQCRHHAGGLRDTFGHLEATLSSLEPTTGTDGALVLRKDTENGGYVFCVAPDHALTDVDKVSRLGELGETGDLSVLGDVRYVTARRSGDATYVVSAWTDGPFKLFKMFPVEGEAPGEDYGGVPRPDGAKRVLSGSIQGAPFGLNAYEVTGDVPTVLKNVDAKLLAAGWRRESAGPDIPDNGRFYALGSSLDLAVSIDDQGAGVSRATYAVSYNAEHLAM